MTSHRDSLVAAYLGTRALTESLCVTLTSEDCNLQSLPCVSPPKWHLAHTTWFFETFVLEKRVEGYEPFHPAFKFLFNSYYESVGPFHEQARRGLLSRPALDQVLAYRGRVDERMVELLEGEGRDDYDAIATLVRLGLAHEEQHQELLLMDTKHNFWSQPLRPAYREAPCPTGDGRTQPLRWIEYAGGVVAIGAEGEGFSFDNEGPRHDVLLGPYRLASRLVTNAEYLEFMRDGGYATPGPWFSEGWNAVKTRGWRAPLYWEERDGEWWHLTLSGMQPVRASDPVCHVSYYEADALARWAGKRLPTEVEWESAAAAVPVRGNFLDSGALRPLPADSDASVPSQLFGDVWEWTMSAYSPYSGFRAPEGALGEYNGKFMCGQMVLRGGACVTPGGHVRPSYRNFFAPDSRWQFGGIRLAEAE